ncbi:hypothetical protein [Bacillus kwashiorkori]|uniref:hypothetical protein n=1 Tax=Bacillus kwashiorkori TaxID=1522318 RepID=UPI00078046B3|nr:hypothetical protein [Bacillus kwashiorkori]
MSLVAIILIAIGLVSSIWGLFPVLFIYPFKDWEASSYWSYILLKDPGRWYWQVGLIVILIGIFLVMKARK